MEETSCHNNLANELEENYILFFWFQVNQASIYSAFWDYVAKPVCCAVLTLSNHSATEFGNFFQTCTTSFLSFVFLNGSVFRYTNTFLNLDVKETMRSFEADMTLRKKVKQNGGNNYLHEYADIMSWNKYNKCILFILKLRDKCKHNDIFTIYEITQTQAVSNSKAKRFFTWARTWVDFYVS